VKKLRVVLADDHPIFRQGLRMLVDAQPDMEVIGEAENGRVATSVAQKLAPDVVVMDVSMPDMNGLKATEALSASCPAIKIITLTRHTDGGYLQQLLDAGSRGYVLKQSEPDEIVRAIRAVGRGQTYLDPAVAGQVVGRVERPSARRRRGNKLSRRQEDVLRLVAWGLLSREIAARLEISIKTVEAHKANAMIRLELENRIEIVRYAVLQGWLEETPI
jgi:DNA-binding NarL/FixJ family response regulator